MACNKDAVIEGDVDNTELGLVQIDSFSLKTKTILDKPINGDDLSSVILGQTNDSRFGETKASFYTQFSLTKNSFSLGTNPVLDSVVLVLKQSDSYGELNSLFDISIYELESELKDISYENNSVLNVNANTLANISNHKFSKGETSLRIPLSTSFGNTLISLFGTNAMESSDNFKNVFKGMYVTTNNTNGDGFVYLKLVNDETKLQLYYHNDEIADTSYSFIVEKKDKTINQYLHDENGSEVLNVIDNENQEIAYVGSMSSYKTEIEMPDLSSLKNIVINKATITVYQADFGSVESINFKESGEMILFQNLQDTSIAFLSGYSISNIGPLAKPAEIEYNGNNTISYTFQITNYIQDLISEESKSNKLYLKNLANNEGNRIKIGGGNNSDYPIKLDIIYTKIN